MSEVAIHLSDVQRVLRDDIQTVNVDKHHQVLDLFCTVPDINRESSRYCRLLAENGLDDLLPLDPTVTTRFLHKRQECRIILIVLFVHE